MPRQCWSCHCPIPARGPAACTTCQAISRGRQRERRAELERAGLCTRCRRRKAKPGCLSCRACLARNTRQVRLLRVNRKLDGLCTRCGLRKCRPGLSECAQCAKKTNADWQRKQYRLADPTLVERVAAYKARQRAANRCQTCGKPAWFNKRLQRYSPHCRKHVLLSSARRRQRQHYQR